MNRFRVALFLPLFAASSLLSSGPALADNFPKPPGAASVPGPRPDIKPGKGMSPDVKGTLEQCTPDPRTGQLRCPTFDGPPAGPAGAACETSAKAEGIWVKKPGATNLSCAVPGESCVSSYGVGKVWSGPDSMVCGAPGDWCPTAAGGGGKVFMEKGALACLALGDQCTCSGDDTDCKVVGIKTELHTYTCAKGYVRCPGLAPVTIDLQPSNGTSRGTVKAFLTGGAKPSLSNVSCEYDVGDEIRASYAIPCHGSYRYNNGSQRYRACLDENRKTYQIACDLPIATSINVDALLNELKGQGITPTMGQTVNVAFVDSGNDAAKETVYCNYRIDKFHLYALTHCAAPSKVAGQKNDYVCHNYKPLPHDPIPHDEASGGK